MDRESFEKALAIVSQLKRVESSIHDIETMKNQCFSIDSFHQDVIDSRIIESIRAEADAKVLAVLQKKKSELEKAFADI